jgi:hypothetical protein
MDIGSYDWAALWLWFPLAVVLIFVLIRKLTARARF